MRIPRDYRGLARLATRQGWTITLAGSGHLSWRAPDGQVLSTGNSPSDPKAVINFKTQLRRAGLDLGDRKRKRS